MRLKAVRHAFVDQIPKTLDEGVVYISIEYGTVVHRCCCGCGNEVVTPLTPVDWSLVYDGETISLDPSVGNWSLDCRSHYWITRGRVRWSYAFSEDEIAETRDEDRRRRRRFFSHRSAARQSRGELLPDPTEDE